MYINLLPNETSNFKTEHSSAQVHQHLKENTFEATLSTMPIKQVKCLLENLRIVDLRL